MKNIVRMYMYRNITNIHISQYRKIYIKFLNVVFLWVHHAEKKKRNVWSPLDRVFQMSKNVCTYFTFCFCMNYVLEDCMKDCTAIEINDTYILSIYNLF